MSNIQQPNSESSLNVQPATAAPSGTDHLPKPMSQFSARLSRGTDRLLGLVLCAVVALNFVSAAARYLGGRAILGSDELQVYAMVWLVFLGGAIVSWRNLHLRMDVISAKARGAVATLRDVFEGVLSMAVCGVMSWVSLHFVLQIHEMGQRSDGAGVPMWIPHAAVFVGFVLMTIAAAYGLFKSLLARSR
jgi:TRAP-type C4-dicarboxylate transport system permease small subunit